MGRRVAITGAGTVNALGPDVTTTWAALAAGRVAIGPMDFEEIERLTVRIGAQIRDWDGAAHFARQEMALYDRAVQFACEAGRQAVAQAGLTLSDEEILRAGVVMGTGVGGQTTMDDSYRAVHAQGKNRVHPFTIPR
ncbi:hypothetical protein OKA06_18620 [Novosphingobium sp. MW5]|nr:hypothetical protein [Novosphingobium sp. MW5]